MTPGSTDWAETYCRHLALDAELLWRHELPVLASAPAFVTARTIVDLGAGDGSYGRRLAAAYPDKSFLGVEPDAAIHAVGARSAFPPNYRYVRAGYDDVAGTHDLLLARHVVMYVADRGALYAWSHEHVRSAIVANWDDAASTMEPPMPLTTAALHEGMRNRADELATTYVGDRALADMPAEWAAAGFAPSGAATVVADVSAPDDRRVLHHIMRLRVMGINPEALSMSLLAELYEWSVDPAARATIGETFHCYVNSVALADCGCDATVAT